MKLTDYLFLLFFAILFILIVILGTLMYFLEPHLWFSSWHVPLFLGLVAILGGPLLIIILTRYLKESINRVKKSKCKNCNNRNRTSALYCETCGEKL